MKKFYFFITTLCIALFTQSFAPAPQTDTSRYQNILTRLGKKSKNYFNTKTYVWHDNIIPVHEPRSAPNKDDLELRLIQADAYLSFINTVPRINQEQYEGISLVYVDAHIVFLITQSYIAHKGYKGAQETRMNNILKRAQRIMNDAEDKRLNKKQALTCFSLDGTVWPNYNNFCEDNTAKHINNQILLILGIR